MKTYIRIHLKNGIHKRFFAFILVCIVCFITVSCSSHTDEIDSPNAVAELIPTDIGGMEQWLLIRGRVRSNPVLLWLHGGPGAAQMPVHHTYTKELENDFVMVHWDQRGAGKSNHDQFLEKTMSVERFVEDIHEVTRFLKTRFNRDKILLLGHSWGSQIGILAAKRYPEDYHAFISVSQVVHPQKGDSISYEWLQERVISSGGKAEIAEFEELGLPPFDDQGTYVAFAKMKDSYGGGMDAGMAELFWNALISDEYTPGDLLKWLDGANRGSGPMWEESRLFNVFEEVPELQIPVWFIAGENDYNTPVELIKAYKEQLQAPEKHMIVIENTAHTPFFGAPDRFRQQLIQIKKSLKKSQMN